MPVIILDTEFTAWEGSMQRDWSGPDEYREIVQIGAVMLDEETLEEIGTLNLIVRPRINPALSDYFTSLTGITNARVAAEGMDFADAMREFLAFCGDAPIWSWGHDCLVLQENIDLYALNHVMEAPRDHDMSRWFPTIGVDVTGVNSGALAAHVGAEVPGREHDALNDVRSIASAIRHVVANGAPNPFLAPSSGDERRAHATARPI